ncbi:MAG: cation-transporting P-type ATPase, partial [Anaerolineales bacterium]|nr:cation-transporting P-type ATPase [Anaerolineales bacterium]
MQSRPIYTLRPTEALTALETSMKGLSSEEAERRLDLFNSNKLPQPTSTPLWRKILNHAIHPMALVLWAAGLLALVSGHPTLPWAIWFVVIINAIFSFWQEYRAEQAVTALSALLPNDARVVRQGQEMLLQVKEIVPGDILVLEQGNNVPADARVVEQYGLRTNQAALTGESLPSVKVKEASLREGLTELERPNLVFMGTSVVSGTGYAVVFATGARTQFGRIARLTQTPEEITSPLEQEIIRLTRVLSVIALAVAATVFGVAIVDVGIPTGEAFLLAIGILVAALPEGLRPTLTLSLAVAVQRMARREVLVKKLATIETLGKVSVICTDKSGTLTHNQMTVKELWVSGQKLSVTGAGYQPGGRIMSGNNIHLPVQDIQAFLTAAVLCNNSRLLPPSDNNPLWRVLGDQTEAALHVCALKAGLNRAMIEGLYPRVHELPFDASRKRMSTIHDNGEIRIAFVKGAPKEVLQCSSHILIAGEKHSLDGKTRQEIEHAIDGYARHALRVLAVARRELPPRQGGYTSRAVENDLTFLGLAAMMDPPRAEVTSAIKTFKEARIRVVMITGDYGLTAETMARRVGMVSAEPVSIVTGSDIDLMDDNALEAIVQDNVLFARVSPEHKLRVVAAFQRRGEIVAVTGDGVNDGPALRKADIGIAMGKTGTDVAREAADIILTNDDFSAIVDAIEEGRAIFRNIRKFMTYILASNIPEILPFILSALFGFPLALTVAQILAIDLGTDLIPALALGVERPEPDIMESAPQKPQQGLINGRLVARSLWLGSIETVLCYIGFFGVFWFESQYNLSEWLPQLSGGAIPSETTYVLARTVFFAGVVTTQIGNAFTARREGPGVHKLGWLSNPYLIGGLAFEIFLALALIYFRPLAQL